MTLSSDFLTTGLETFAVDPQKQNFGETAAPAKEPVTVAEAKTFARIATASEDTLVGTLITAARIEAEKWCNRVFIERAFQLFIDRSPMSLVLEFPVTPIQSITQVSSFSEDDTETVFAATKYRFDDVSVPPRIVLKRSNVWPTDTRNSSSFKVTFLAGYGPNEADVPGPIKEAIKVIFAHLWELRGQIEEKGDAGTTGSGSLVGRLPQDAILLLSPFRVVYLG
jgi:uncharacterized phiE125 gp8 family phage protein